MPAEQPVTIFFHILVKEGREEEFSKLAVRLTESSRQEDGCLEYTIFQQVDSLRAHVLIERWRDRQAIAAHIGRLQAEFGPPRPGQTGLPAALLDFFEESHGVRYRAVE